MDLQQLAAQHRAALIQRDVAFAGQIYDHYQAMWSRILARLAVLAKLISDAQQAGQPVKISWLYEQRRLQLFLDEVYKEVQTFAAWTQTNVQQQMHHAAQIGAHDAILLLDHQLGNVLGSFNRLPEHAIRQAVYNVETDAHLQKLFGSFDDQAVALVKKRLVSAVGLGEHPREIARDIQQALKVPLNRALTIARTEVVGAWRDAALNNYRANADVVQEWEWSAAAGACPFCQSMDGKRFPLGQDMDSHPNCRCAALPVTRSVDDILAELAA